MLALLLSLALVGAAALAAMARWRTRRLNCAMHELRRPLQVLQLSDSAPPRAIAAQIRTALADLDEAINGHSGSRVCVPVPLRTVTASLAARWAHADVRVLEPSADATIVADPQRLGAAIDNLIANGLDHGTGTVEVRASAGAEAATIEVRDGGPSGVPGPRRRDPRHGHGLRIAAAAASGSGGRLIAPFAEEGGATVAAIALPARRTRSV